jgi:hypothetical protein
MKAVEKLPGEPGQYLAEDPSNPGLVVKWFGSTRNIDINPIWVFEYILRYVVPEEKNPPTYHRWIHELHASKTLGSYILRIYTGEGALIDVKNLGSLDEIDIGETLYRLSELYTVTYRDRLRSLNAYSEEAFNISRTLEKLYTEIYRAKVFPLRVVLLESIRDHGEVKELNQTVLHVNWIYVMMFE